MVRPVEWDGSSADIRALSPNYLYVPTASEFTAKYHLYLPNTGATYVSDGPLANGYAPLAGYSAIHGSIVSPSTQPQGDIIVMFRSGGPIQVQESWVRIHALWTYDSIFGIPLDPITDPNFYAKCLRLTTLDATGAAINTYTGASLHDGSAGITFSVPPDSVTGEPGWHVVEPHYGLKVWHTNPGTASKAFNPLSIICTYFAIPPSDRPIIRQRQVERTALRQSQSHSAFQALRQRQRF